MKEIIYIECCTDKQIFYLRIYHDDEFKETPLRPKFIPDVTAQFCLNPYLSCNANKVISGKKFNQTECRKPP